MVFEYIGGRPFRQMFEFVFLITKTNASRMPESRVDSKGRYQSSLTATKRAFLHLRAPYKSHCAKSHDRLPAIGSIEQIGVRCELALELR